MKNIFKQMYHIVTKKNRNVISHLHIIQVNYFSNLFLNSFKYFFFCIHPINISCLPTMCKSLCQVLDIGLQGTLIQEGEQKIRAPFTGNGWDKVHSTEVPGTMKAFNRNIWYHHRVMEMLPWERAMQSLYGKGHWRVCSLPRM